MSAEEGGTARQAAIGAFVLVGTGLALAAIVLFGNFHPFSHTIKAAIVFQDSISGLSIGAPVTFRGVHVGAVAAIAVQFDQETQTALIPVTVQLDPGGVVLTTQGSGMALNLPDLVTHGLRAELNTQSFVTGQSEIDLNFYPNEPAVLHPSLTTLPEIPTRQSTLQRVRDELSQLPLHELAENTLATLRSLRGLTEKLDQSLPPRCRLLGGKPLKVHLGYEVRYIERFRKRRFFTYSVHKTWRIYEHTIGETLGNPVERAE